MTNKKPLVSILIPVYNSLQTLEKSLNCAINQTYKNIEIVISDNASTQKISKIYYKKKFKKIKIIRQKKNIGGIRNYNYLINNSKGEFFFFLHSDDIVSKNYVEKCIQHMTSDKTVSIVVGKVYQSDGCYIGSHKLNFNSKSKRLINYFSNNYPDSYINGLIRKKFVKNFSLKFISCEIPFLVELISNGRLKYSKECFYKKNGSNLGRPIEKLYDWYFLKKNLFTRYGYFFECLKIIFKKLNIIESLIVALIFALYNLPILRIIFIKSKPYE